MSKQAVAGGVCLFGAVLAFAQSQLPPPQAAGNLPVQKIGASDLIALSVYQSPELTRTVRVSPEGDIRLPMLKKPIPAAGLMPGELEQSIAEALRAEQIFVDPVVTVNIVEYHSRPISVAGAVKRPVTFQAVGMVTLLDAVTRAEGLGELAGPEILITRRQQGPDGNLISLVQRVPVRGLIDQAEPEFNLRLYGGEEIRVPEAGRVFVVGNVKRPGSYPVHDAADTTVLKMLALSEGLAPFASKMAYILRKEERTGVKNEIPLELGKILARKSPDVPLMANDILYVPDNTGRRATSGALEKLAAFGSATASGLLIWGTR